MLETTQSQKVRNKYILRLASDFSESEENILRIKNIISYDSWLDEATYDLIDDDDTDEQKARCAENYKKSLEFWKEVQVILKKAPESYVRVQKNIEEYIGMLEEYCESFV